MPRIDELKQQMALGRGDSWTLTEGDCECVFCICSAPAWENGAAVEAQFQILVHKTGTAYLTCERCWNIALNGVENPERDASVSLGVATIYA